MVHASAVPQAPEDTHYGLRAAYESDESPEKVNLVIGAYRDNNGRPWTLPVIRKAEAIFFHDPNRNNEYPPIAGVPEFTAAAQKLILGSESPAIKEGRVCSFQTISGTGAVHLGGAFLSRFLGQSDIYLSDPTWDNHAQVFSNVGLSIKWYPYFSKKTLEVDIEAMLLALQAAPTDSIVLLQPCAHNPTGADLSLNQWERIAQILQARRLLPFFDCAYQGFATGLFHNDNAAIRLFADLGMEMLIAQSFSKNLGLYGHRVGCLHYVGPPNAPDTTLRVASQIAILQRSEISTPPIYGAKLASIVLNDEKLFTEWERDLCIMANRIKEMRIALRQELERLQTPGNWDRITTEIGMFSYTGLSAAQVAQLKDQWHIYMLPSGRVSMAGLNTSNVKYFATAVDAVVRRVTET
ncbi:unnamed protein product [Clonostachys rhizophaga]|uniref:Aspartate aminotransferase n=1 Tax=Clonostachys rhizophaga TaxID=160324 RepID=A0A9N9VCU7_9HYPO|nr:unnamed protein product [Clonostachys rhizophaga]